MRAMGFFEDPTVGIVQIPHAFYNNDPMQTNLSLRQAMPDDQRFFFETTVLIAVFSVVQFALVLFAVNRINRRKVAMAQESEEAS